MTIGATTSFADQRDDIIALGDESPCRWIADSTADDWRHPYDRSGDMTPRFATDRLTSARLATTIFPREFAYLHACAPVRSHGHDLILIEHGQPYVAPANVSSAALGAHVSVVFGVGSEPEMVRIATRRVVASVADDHAGRNRSLGQDPRNPIGSYRSTSHRGQSVSEMTLCPAPFDAAAVGGVAPGEEFIGRPLPSAAFYAVFSHNAHKDKLS